MVDRSVRLIGIIRTEVLKEQCADLREGEFENASVNRFCNLGGVCLDRQKVEVGLTEEHRTVLKAGLKDVGRDLVGSKGAEIVDTGESSKVVVRAEAVLKDNGSLGEFEIKLEPKDSRGGWSAGSGDNRNKCGKIQGELHSNKFYIAGTTGGHDAVDDGLEDGPVGSCYLVVDLGPAGAMEGKDLKMVRVHPVGIEVMEPIRLQAKKL